MFILDEPTRALHASDVSRLLPVLRELTDRRHSVVVVEHDIDVIRNADWVVDLGPGGGEAGGTVPSSGPPDGLASAARSSTGRFVGGGS